MARRCAWVLPQMKASVTPVWLRRNIQTGQCPKSLITAQSQRYLNLFNCWKQVGPSAVDMTAKEMDAIQLIEQEWQKEKEYVKAENINF